MSETEPLFSKTPWPYSISETEQSDISGVGIDLQVTRLPPEKKRYYRKSNGRLYRCEYKIVGRKLVYSEEEVSDFVDNEVERYLKVSLFNGEFRVVNLTSNNETEQVIMKNEGTIVGDRPLITEWSGINRKAWSIPTFKLPDYSPNTTLHSPPPDSPPPDSPPPDSPPPDSPTSR